MFRMIVVFSFLLSLSLSFADELPCDMDLINRLSLQYNIPQQELIQFSKENQFQAIEYLSNDGIPDQTGVAVKAKRTTLINDYVVKYKIKEEELNAVIRNCNNSTNKYLTSVPQDSLFDKALSFTKEWLDDIAAVFVILSIFYLLGLWQEKREKKKSKIS